MSRYCVSSATLLQIEEELEEEDRDMIFFACRDITSQTNIRELLSELNEKSVPGMVEALWLVKRFDLLKKYLKMTKNEAEQLIKKQSKVISDFSYLLLDINGHLEEEDLQSLVFLLKNQLRNAGHVKKTFLSLVTDLEKNNLISPENLDLLEQSLKTIHRIDLKSKIHKFKQKGHTENGSHYIPSFAVPPTLPRNSVSTSFAVQLKYVPATSKASQLQVESSNDRYPVRPNSMGYCLIIDCVGNDSEMLKHLFLGLRFTLNIKMYKSVQDAKNIMQDVAKMEQLKQYDIFICILISRGNADSLSFIDGSSYGLPLETVRSFFTGQSCPNLVGKPKLFFIQNYITEDCEVQHDGGSVEADGPSCNGAGQERRRSSVKTPNEADIFWSHCKASERQLQRLSGAPSLYLKTLNDLLSNKQKRKNQDIQELHTELNRILYSKENGCSLLLQHTLTKKLFMSPA
ncbi:PREDICTED: CASP8 and FADD-like apoptosis regulator [Nanorana parkeri]|uniref:CASP8 and FADD-like apoptosis regulator n=1 Tax=Nanorana parkeri TaxID=125878 RepID=UPI000854C788|nr:PREDICTED: CASP8 and FADD-like apoptosis regulator [Nanorana parkeri]